SFRLREVRLHPRLVERVLLRGQSFSDRSGSPGQTRGSNASVAALPTGAHGRQSFEALRDALKVLQFAKALEARREQGLRLPGGSSKQRDVAEVPDAPRLEVPVTDVRVDPSRPRD